MKGEPLSAEDEALLDRLAAEVVKRRMQAPAVLFLESVKPLNFMGSQALTFLQPIVGTLFSTVQWERIAAILERREAIERLIRGIERG